MPSPSLPQFIPALKAFTSHPSVLRIIHSHPSAPIASQISTLLILDSSFNPPTRAHAWLVEQAIARLRRDRRASPSSPAASPTVGRKGARGKARVLLVLSTKNADKPSAPASLQKRLAMMVLFAREIWDSVSLPSSSIPSSSAGDDSALPEGSNDDDAVVSGIDIALSSEPRFLEKSVFLSSSSSSSGCPSESQSEEGEGQGIPYAARSSSGGEEIGQWHLLGFDTLVRLLDGKYYPPNGSLDVLRPLFEKEGNRIVVVRRGGQDGNVDGDEQGTYVKALSVSRDDGGFDAEGWDPAWGGKVELINAYTGSDGEQSVSSTVVRDAAKQGDVKIVHRLCAPTVADYVLDEQLYS